jgi:hypothetical protein
MHALTKPIRLYLDHVDDADIAEFEAPAVTETTETTTP